MTPRGAIYEDEHEERHRLFLVRHVLQEIADAQGDVDAYILQQTEYSHVPAIAANIAERLLKAGRDEEALLAINDIDEHRNDWIPVEWEMIRVKVLETLDRKDEAQAKATAVAKPLTIVMTCLSIPKVARASSIGPLSRPWQDTIMCRPEAYRAAVISP